MDLVRQEDILFLEKNSIYVLVLSRDFFNKSGTSAMLCRVFLSIFHFLNKEKVQTKKDRRTDAYVQYGGLLAKIIYGGFRMSLQGVSEDS